MIYERCRPTENRVERADKCRVPDALLVERAIKSPPDELEDLDKVAWRSGWGRHATGECGIEVCVTADVPRHDQPTGAVNDLVFAGLCCPLDPRDVSVLDPDFLLIESG